MYTPDRLPETIRNAPFPRGDVTDRVRLRVADEWFAKAETCDREEFMRRVESSSTPDTSAGWQEVATFQTAARLCQWWDKQRGDDTGFALAGFQTARAFMRDTEFIPEYDIHMGIQLDRMRTENDPLIFAREAWAGMARSHPIVFAQHEKLYDLSSRWRELELAENGKYFIAGLCLPYMLSVASQLEHRAKAVDLTGLTGESIDLQQHEFVELFASGTPLAHKKPSKRLTQ